MASEIRLDADPVASETLNIPIACSLTADELVVRGEENAALFEQAVGVRELPDGYAFAFGAETTKPQDLLTFVVAERACCPFFTFELTFPAPHEVVWLEVRGAEGAKEVARETFDSVSARLAG